MSTQVENPSLVETQARRLERIDTLLCILFHGLLNSPLAPTLIPPDQIAELRAILPTE